jgi:hypothetical protein
VPRVRLSGHMTKTMQESRTGPRPSAFATCDRSQIPGDPVALSRAGEWAPRSRRVPSRRSTTGTGGTWSATAAFPIWRPDGKELYYLNPAGAILGASIAVAGAALAFVYNSRLVNRRGQKCRPFAAGPDAAAVNCGRGVQHTGSDHDSTKYSSALFHFPQRGTQLSAVERFFVSFSSVLAVSRCFCATGYVSAAH